MLSPGDHNLDLNQKKNNKTKQKKSFRHNFWWVLERLSVFSTTNKCSEIDGGSNTPQQVTENSEAQQGAGLLSKTWAHQEKNAKKCYPGTKLYQQKWFYIIWLITI